MKKKTIILSYDYELFFGDKSGTVQRTLINPTNLLLDAMDKVGFKGNFFVDYLMLKYLSKETDEICKKDYALLVAQIQDMIRRGHRVELHIHPHWVDAHYNGDGTWNFEEFKHYGLDSFACDEVTAMFVEGKMMLESIAKDVDATYELVAFRAGGWAVQPFDLLKDGFAKSGIKIDSSVAGGIYLEKDNTVVDFRNAPKKSMYHFINDVCKETEEGELLEVPISTYKRDLFTSGLSYLLRRFAKKPLASPDGTHLRTSDAVGITTGILQRQNMPAMFSLDSIPFRTWFKIISSHESFLCFIDHPKDFNSYTLENVKVVSRLGNSITYKELLSYK